MSKLGALIAIPIALWGVKQLQKQVKEDPTPQIIPEGFTLGPAAGPIVDIFPEGPIGTVGAVVGPTTGIVATGPTVPLGRGQVWTPLFPDTAAGAAETLAASTPINILQLQAASTGLQALAEYEYKPFTLDDGMFDLSKAWSTIK